LRFGENLCDDILGARLERVELRQRREVLIVLGYGHTWARHERLDILTGEVLPVVKVTRVGRRLEFAFGADAVAVAKIGEWRPLNEHQSTHSAGWLIGTMSRSTSTRKLVYLSRTSGSATTTPSTITGLGR